MNKTSKKSIRTFLIGTSLALGVVVGLAPTSATAAPLDPGSKIVLPCDLTPAGCKPPVVVFNICIKHPEICKIAIPIDPPKATIPNGPRGTLPPAVKTDPTPPPVVVDGPRDENSAISGTSVVDSPGSTPTIAMVGLDAVST